jgi:hypothetical protein
VPRNRYPNATLRKGRVRRRFGQPPFEFLPLLEEQLVQCVRCVLIARIRALIVRRAVCFKSDRCHTQSAAQRASARVAVGGKASAR